MGSEISYNVDDIQKDYMPDRYGSRRLLAATDVSDPNLPHKKVHCDYEDTK